MTARKATVAITAEPIIPDLLYREFTASTHGAGATVTFTGSVRNDAETVHSLFLDVYPGMTERTVQKIADAAITRFGATALRVVHRCGWIGVTEPIVFVAAAADHRRNAFQAAEFTMDWLKSQAPFWKREVGPGLDRWVEPTTMDNNAVCGWGQ